MGVGIKKINVLMDSITYEPVLPYYFIEEEELNEYLKENPFPADEHYTLEMMKLDFKIPEGMLCFEGITDAQIEWIENCLADFM